MNSYDIIKRPILTEKSYSGIQIKKYIFEVDRKATKPQIKAAIEQIFSVKVKSVNTINSLGKLKRQGKTEGYRPDFKKAIILLTADSKPIQLFESLS